jgi:hypothetical protein
MKEGCIWDDSVIFKGQDGLCKSGDCRSLTSEEDCSSISNNNKCAYVAGSCTENPCLSSDCEGVITAGCKLMGEGRCVVDECMKYDEEGCKVDGSSKCVLMSVGNKDRCVSGECSILQWHDDCDKNDIRCRIVQDVCVENPCTDTACSSPACKYTTGECVYDSCARYKPSGSFF